MSRVTFWKTTTAFAASFTAASWGLGLGDVSVQSYLNEPLRAELTLLEATDLDPADIRIGLASAQEFERLGIARSQFLNKVSFEVQASDTARLAVITTEQPLREPYLNFVVEARWPEGRLLREYTLLIDLPPTEAYPVSESALEPSPREADAFEKEFLDLKSGSAAGIRPGGTYLVRNSDTLWRIASSAKPDGITIEQAMLSIVGANPEAFDAGNVNGLKSGYLLSLPNAEEISITSDEARVEVLRQNAAWSGAAPAETPGLKLIADPPPEAERAIPNEIPEAVVTLPLQDEEVAGLGMSDGSSAPTTVEPVPVSPDFDALLSKVEALERNLERMERQLNERDVELERLQTQLLAATRRAEAADSDRRMSAAGGNVTTLPDWIWLGAIGVLISGGLGVWWGQRRRAPARSGGTHTEDSGASSVLPGAETRSAMSNGSATESADESAAPDPAPMGGSGHNLQGGYLAGVDPEPPASRSRAEDEQADAGLALVPVMDPAKEGATSAAAQAAPPGSSVSEESIYGLETDPIDSKLDLARAYLDMGDEAGARPVLSEVIKEGNLSQQAEARELLLRLEIS